MVEAVEAARRAQEKRYRDTPYRFNSEVKAADFERLFALEGDVSELVDKLLSRLGFSASGYSNLMRIARTIADLDTSLSVRKEHVCEAASYLFLNRISGKD